MNNANPRGTSMGLLVLGILATVVAIWALAGAPGTVDDAGNIIVTRTLGTAALILGGAIGVGLLVAPRRKSDDVDRTGRPGPH